MPLCTRPRPRANEAHPPSQRRAGGLEQLEGWSSWIAWAERAELMKGLAHVLSLRCTRRVRVSGGRPARRAGGLEQLERLG
jgi:hypothetical protein